LWWPGRASWRSASSSWTPKKHCELWHWINGARDTALCPSWRTRYKPSSAFERRRTRGKT
jgi:hypothetical protein